MKLICNGFKTTGTDSEDHIYFFKATFSGEDLFFELTNSEIAEITDDGDYQLPPRFDFGFREPMICQLLHWMHTVYWKDEDGILEGCTIEMTRPEGV